MAVPTGYRNKGACLSESLLKVKPSWCDAVFIIRSKPKLAIDEIKPYKVTE